MTIIEIKRLFFTYRNGVLTEKLRAIGTPHRMIFGLNISQIAEIASIVDKNIEIADELWNDRETRESRLLALYLYPIEEVSRDKALSLAVDIRTVEEADILCFKILKKNLDMEALVLEIEKYDTPLMKYCVRRLRQYIDES